MAERGNLEANSYEEKIQDRKVPLLFRKQKVRHMPLISSEINNRREVVNGGVMIKYEQEYST